MNASKDKVVTIAYTLTVEGETVDQGELAYIHGHQQIIPGLEKEIEGRAAGESFEVTVAPEEAYGERNEEGVQVVPRSAFPDDAKVEVGEQFYAQDDQGNPLPLTVTKVEGEDVTVDFNHPLAGKTLNFAVEIKEVRDATPEELAHGHVHGPGGHHH
ncbi:MULTISPECIES: peptidylprolyl isomerase [Oceanithermus]|uniref:Peptidyl-prolyl cis-trans isomerase n=3 Tax=Oceanithermus TaxID=208447 RepID=A0A511RP44_9DEIN|nr:MULTISPECIES: peptidylprolyl isomerase [Oceanithermus]MBB6030038.1 FKBP-type peptidyl-prolyl cis-trans isomerase SlyD [Oceanithermus desulfurans]GEM90702.1 peptidyl-prolyl cis-trans isomerase [Oceanithermus desulfurans NBRC 100063]